MSNAVVVKNLFRNFKSKKSNYQAVRGISFEISSGERVAFIGPNGAGKSTTIKILCGVLYPTSGMVEVLGKTPWVQRKELARKIGVVFGQRSQLWYHLPAVDSFNLISKIYDIAKPTYLARKSELVKRFEIEHLLEKPVRQLSLGERMRCEIVGSLLHEPEILFLDEPTVGLDANAKAIIRDLVKEYSVKRKMTVLLTSHDTGDIEKVCERALIINQGTILRNQSLLGLKQSVILSKLLKFNIAAESITLPEVLGLKVIESRAHQLTVEVESHKLRVNDVLQKVLALTEIIDFSVEDPPMDEVLKAIYKGEKERGHEKRV